MAYAVRLEPIRYRQRDLARALILEIPRAIDNSARRAKQLFESCVASWGHAVKFEIWQTKLSNGRVTIVGTKDPIFNFVDGGTKEHLIFPVRAKMLVFQWGGKGSYKAKTSPGVIGSGPGGPTGPIVRSKGVVHPGTKARGFTHAIQSYWGTSFAPEVQEAITRALKTT